MSVNMSGPAKLMLAVIFGLAMCVAAIVALAATGIGGAPVSTALISTNTGLTNALPFIGIMVAAGLVFVAMGRK